MLRVTFRLKKMEKICVAWQNKGKTKVIIAENWEKNKGQVIKLLNPDKNRRFKLCLMIKIEKE